MGKKKYRPQHSMETYIEADESTRNKMTYELLVDIMNSLTVQVSQCDIRFGVLEEQVKPTFFRKIKYPAILFIGGVFGGGLMNLLNIVGLLDPIISIMGG